MVSPHKKVPRHLRHKQLYQFLKSLNNKQPYQLLKSLYNKQPYQFLKSLFNPLARIFYFFFNLTQPYQLSKSFCNYKTYTIIMPFNNWRGTQRYTLQLNLISNKNTINKHLQTKIMHTLAVFSLAGLAAIIHVKIVRIWIAEPSKYVNKLCTYAYTYHL